MNPLHRQAGRITFVLEPSPRDAHDCVTADVGFRFDDGGTQSFGGLSLDAESRRIFWRELCDVFGVSSYELLVDKPAIALFSFGEYNETIEGLESPDGRRFTISGFQRRHYPDQAKSPLEARRQSLLQGIRLNEERIAGARERLELLDKDFIDWESLASHSKAPGTFANKNGLNECSKCGFAWDQSGGEICSMCALRKRDVDWMMAFADMVKAHGFSSLLPDEAAWEKLLQEVAEEYLPLIHLIFSNLKAWINGVHHGVSEKHLQSYLNEFTFRFNRRFYPLNTTRSTIRCRRREYWRSNRRPQIR